MNDLVLEDKRARLSPLTLDNYRELEAIAAQPGLVAYSPSAIESPEDLRAYVTTALEKQERRECIPFIVFDKQAETYAGSTRYMHISWPNKLLHIGSTWLGREFHGTGLNTHMKYLMLQHAFETMKFEKVEFRIDERNLQSRRAVEKLGATLEGILKKDVYLQDGFKRNTCCYGILLEEWAPIKSTLFRRLK